MPSTSAKQAKFMRAVAHSPKFAKRVGVPQSVGKDYEMADKKMRKFASAGKVGRSAQEGIDKALENINASTPKPDMKDDTIAKATAPKNDLTFKEAFKANRMAGNKTFTWGGKSYTTDVASGGAKRPAAASAPKVSTPKASAPTTNTRAQLEMRRTATRSQAAIREKRAENQADFRKRMQGKTAASAKGAVNAGRSEGFLSRFGKSDTGKTFAERQKQKYGYAKGGSIDGCAVRGKTRAPMKKGK